MLALRPEGEEGGYLLEQHFAYSYASPVHGLRHRLMAVPRAVHGSQRRLDHRVEVRGARVHLSQAVDGFDNEVVEIRAGTVAEEIHFEVWALVTGVAGGRSTGTAPVPSGALRDRRLLDQTPLTATDALLTDAAGSLAAASDGSLDLAERICDWTSRSLSYGHDFTDVRTPADAALAGGRGVCQDYAHVMLAACRAAGLAARYVSGHLVGEGGSHAWVEVVVDRASMGAGAGSGGAAVAVAFDPTHGRRAREGYVTVGIGRDYSDVTPTSGSFQGACEGVLTAKKRLRPADVFGDDRLRCP